MNRIIVFTGVRLWNVRDIDQSRDGDTLDVCKPGVERNDPSGRGSLAVKGQRCDDAAAFHGCEPDNDHAHYSRDFLVDLLQGSDNERPLDDPRIGERSSVVRYNNVERGCILDPDASKLEDPVPG